MLDGLLQWGLLYLPNSEAKLSPLWTTCVQFHATEPKRSVHSRTRRDQLESITIHVLRPRVPATCYKTEVQA